LGSHDAEPRRLHVCRPDPIPSGTSPCPFSLWRAGSIFTGSGRHPDTARRAHHPPSDLGAAPAGCPLSQNAAPQEAAPSLSALPHPLRFLACDGTTVQRPGAISSDDRLHLVINLVTLGFHEVRITETTTGESLKHYQLQAGDVIVGDRGYCSYSGMLDTVCHQ